MNQTIYKYSNIILLSLLIIRIILLLFNIHFLSASIENYFWFFVIIPLILNWSLSIESVYRKGLVILSIVGLIILVVNITLYIVKPNKEKALVFEDYNYWGWSEFEQQAWGGTPHCYLAFGETYLNGLFYRKIEVFEYDCDTGDKESINFEIPSNVDLDDCIFNRKKGILFDLKHGKIYRQNKSY
jgi:hypothetical protein